MAAKKFENGFALSTRILLMLFIICILSCGSDDTPSNSEELTGEWRLIEVLADPGDGSGRFSPVESQRRISILEDGTFSSNGELCDFSIAADGSTQGSVLKDDQGFFLACEAPFTSRVRLSLEDGKLIVTFFCIEPCQHKYERTD